jgi:hypothetical protein
MWKRMTNNSSSSAIAVGDTATLSSFTSVDDFRSRSFTDVDMDEKSDGFSAFSNLDYSKTDTELFAKLDEMASRVDSLFDELSHLEHVEPNNSKPTTAAVAVSSSPVTPAVAATVAAASTPKAPSTVGAVVTKDTSAKAIKHSPTKTITRNQREMLLSTTPEAALQGKAKTKVTKKKWGGFFFVGAFLVVALIHSIY